MDLRTEAGGRKLKRGGSVVNLGPGLLDYEVREQVHLGSPGYWCMMTSPVRYVSGTSSCLHTALGFVCGDTWRPNPKESKCRCSNYMKYVDYADPNAVFWRTHPSFPSIHYTAC